MTPRSIVILLALLALTSIAACNASDVAVPDTTTATKVAVTAATGTTTPTEKSSGAKNVIPIADLSDADAPQEILLGVEGGSLCKVFGGIGSSPHLPPERYIQMVSARGDWADENYIRWSPDGSQILFDVSGDKVEGPVDLYAVAADGSRLEKIVDASAKGSLWGTGGSMMYFDVSPDGSRIAYSACAYNRKLAEANDRDE